MPLTVPPLRLDALAARTGATLERAGRGDIAFLANPRYRAQLEATQASAVIVAPSFAHATKLPKLLSRNPYATYARVAALLYAEEALSPGIHPAALVEAGAQVAASASIGPFAVIAAGAVVGERTRIGARVTLGADARIGDDCVLHANVVVYPRCVIGARALIHAGAVIGADGFGMARDEGRWLKIPQTGRVVIGDDVEIGANSSIDRGALDDTLIGNDVKIDNQVQIGHNCVVGDHTAIAGCAGIAGSVHIGRDCQIGGAAMIAGHLALADGVIVSGGTLVSHSIAAPGVYTSAFPALPHAQWKRVASETRRLRELALRVRALEAALGAAAVRGAPAHDNLHDHPTETD
jgi:UDP-3-O-[3-hydroxymyristoyl] glucosamine N-acyltransferase